MQLMFLARRLSSGQHLAEIVMVQVNNCYSRALVFMQILEIFRIFPREFAVFAFVASKPGELHSFFTWKLL
jgi:hypothetical protein